MEVYLVQDNPTSKAIHIFCDLIHVAEHIQSHPNARVATCPSLKQAECFRIAREWTSDCDALQIESKKLAHQIKLAIGAPQNSQYSIVNGPFQLVYIIQCKHYWAIFDLYDRKPQYRQFHNESVGSHESILIELMMQSSNAGSERTTIITNGDLSVALKQIINDPQSNFNYIRLFNHSTAVLVVQDASSDEEKVMIENITKDLKAWLPHTSSTKREHILHQMAGRRKVRSTLKQQRQRIEILPSKAFHNSSAAIVVYTLQARQQDEKVAVAAQPVVETVKHEEPEPIQLVFDASNNRIHNVSQAIQATHANCCQLVNKNEIYAELEKNFINKFCAKSLQSLWQISSQFKHST